MKRIDQFVCETLNKRLPKWNLIKIAKSTCNSLFNANGEQAKISFRREYFMYMVGKWPIHLEIYVCCPFLVEKSCNLPQTT